MLINDNFFTLISPNNICKYQHWEVILLVNHKSILCFICNIWVVKVSFKEVTFFETVSEDKAVWQLGETADEAGGLLGVLADEAMWEVRRASWWSERAGSHAPQGRRRPPPEAKKLSPMRRAFYILDYWRFKQVFFTFQALA